MNYYCIRYRQQRYDLKDCCSGAYYYLPTAYTVTVDKELALSWFDEVVKQIRNMYGTEKVEVRDVKLDHRCIIKEATFENNQPAFAKGRYAIELNCYTFNPHLEK